MRVIPTGRSPQHTATLPTSFILILLIALTQPVIASPAGRRGRRPPSVSSYNHSRVLLWDGIANWHSQEDTFTLHGPVGCPKRFTVNRDALFGADGSAPRWMSFSAVETRLGRPSSKSVIEKPKRRGHRYPGAVIPPQSQLSSTPSNGDKNTSYLYNGMFWVTLEKGWIEVELTGPKQLSMKLRCFYSEDRWNFDCVNDAAKSTLARYTQSSDYLGFQFIPNHYYRHHLPSRLVFDLMTVVFIYSRLFIRAGRTKD